MEYNKIKQLMDDMGNSNLTSMDIEFPDGYKISMKKEVLNEKDITSIENKKIKFSDEEIKINNISNTRIEKNEKIVKSPMVGTFYIKSSPTAVPYVQIGKNVKIGDTLCIIEAMKLMNEIESEITGKITKIFIGDGEPVEYGTPLFQIEEEEKC